MSGLSQYQKFKLATWEYLKTRGYKTNGQQNFIYKGKEFWTVVNIQAGKHAPLDYGFYNITYARLEKIKPTIWNGDFFQLRHDSFGPHGFIQMGSSGACFYKPDVSFSTDKKILSAIKMLEVIEPIFRVETKEELISLYSNRWGGDKELLNEYIEKLTCNAPVI